MTIDATMEDLEAQAYFAKRLVAVEHVEAPSFVRIKLCRSNLIHLDLNYPIAGIDFLSGFTSISGSSCWVAVPISAVAWLETALLAPCFNSIDQPLTNVLGEKFAGLNIRLYFHDGSAKSGELAQNADGFIALSSETGNLSIPSTAISYVAVENLSKLAKVLAT
jgi:hypothetical protein